jgi:hypothetical protein
MQVQAQVVQNERQIVKTEETAMLQEVGIYAYRHPLDDAVAYKGRLDELKDQIKVQARSGDAVHSITDWQVNGSAAEGRSAGECARVRRRTPLSTARRSGSLLVITSIRHPQGTVLPR